MKILFVIPIYFEDNQILHFQTLGGGERYPFELARFLSLNNAKDEVKIILFGSCDHLYEIDGIQIEVIKGIKLFPSINGNFSPLPFSLNFFRNLSWADIIHGFHNKADTTLITAIIAKMTDKPFFLTDLGGGCRYSISRLVDIQPLVTLALCISKYDSNFWTIKNKKVIYGGVDIKKYPYKFNKEKYILFVGRILPHKGVDRLINALPNNVKLIIAGRSFDKNYLSYVKKLARNKDVHFNEDLTDTELIRLYQNATCFILPSTHKDYTGKIHKKTELLGLVVIEAMACGTPVIVSSAASLPELVINGYNGYVFTDGDTSDLTEKIKKIMINKKSISQLGKNARQMAETKFSWITIAKKVRKIYEDYT